jgi:flagellar biosynthesis protein
MTDKQKKLSQKEGFKNIKKSVSHLSDVIPGKKRHAIAIKYDVEKGRAPKIMATGKGNIADMILQVAEENKVPFYEDSSLSDLLSKLELDAEIPAELYTLVAEVLAFVYQLDKLAKKRQRVKEKYGDKNKDA